MSASPRTSANINGRSVGHGLASHAPESEFDIDEAEQYVTLLERFLDSVDYSLKPAGYPVRIPAITCPKCDEPVAVN